MRFRARLRLLALGAATVSGFRRTGYFVPLARAADLPPLGSLPPYQPVGACFATRHAAFQEIVAEIERLGPALETIAASAAAPAPRWRQDWFPRLDAAVAYVLVRTRKPARIVEVGSGHSTRFLARAIADGELATRLVAVDPAPRAPLPASVDHIRLPVHRAPEPFDGLARGDILFVDSSHVLMPGSDVDYLLNRIWPALPSGTLAHFHDVFLPDDYPHAWAWRGYNEQQGVAPLITGGAAEVLFSSRYVTTRLGSVLAGTVVERLPLEPGAVETSLWLKKR